MNTINRFKEIEDNFLRGDLQEGRHIVKQGDFLKLKINNKWIEFNKKNRDFNCQLYYEYERTNGNIFSLYTLFMPMTSNKIVVDKKNLEFGDTCLLISYTDEFMKRVSAEMEKKKINLQYGLVQYYNYKTFSGKAGVFHKSNKFEYQNEFRLFIENENIKSFILRLGSINDISKIFNSKDLLDITVEKK